MVDGLRLQHLQVRHGQDLLVREASLSLDAGQVVGLVGASGSGKSLTARSLLGLVPHGLSVEASLEVTIDGRVHHPYNGPPRGLHARFAPLRGPVLGFLPQNAGRSLDPFRTVAKQTRNAGRGAPPEPFLVAAGFRESELPILGQRYPHELSGGMAQRVALAGVLARGSRFIIADEPTTGLDASVQRQLLAHLAGLARGGLGILVVSHDLRWLGELADHVLVMAGGTLVETFSETPVKKDGKRLFEAAERLRSVGFP